MVLLPCHLLFQLYAADGKLSMQVYQRSADMFDGTDGIEVWMQERVLSMPNYPGITVFPGGGVDFRDFPPRAWNDGDLTKPPLLPIANREVGENRYRRSSNPDIVRSVLQSISSTARFLETQRSYSAKNPGTSGC